MPACFRIWRALITATILLWVIPVSAGEPHWLRIDTGHFSVFTDADEKHGREAAVRFEQMREVFVQLLMKNRLNWSEPIEIVALKSDEEFSKIAPTSQNESIARGGFFIGGEDREYFVLNVSADQGWQAVAEPFARVLLNYNYPPTQEWFDTGFVEYFSSLRLDDKTMQIGGDPRAGLPGKPFADLLNASAWIPMAQLFTMQPTAGTHEMFDAESWIVMHYLIKKEKMSETGNYFGLVQVEKLPVEDALQKAYGMNVTQFQQAVKDYFQSIAGQLQTEATAKGAAQQAQNPAPVTSDDIGSSTHEMPEPAARAYLAEMSLRLPEHREQSTHELESLVAQPLTESAIAHRGLGWAYLEKKEYDRAMEEFGKASELDQRDPWAHYYMALVRYREAQSSGHELQGLANMQQNLHAVLDWDPEFANAYGMLAKAQTEGGGLHAAMDSVRAAIRLSPRNQGFLLEMAEIYMASKNFEAATALLQRLTSSPDTQVATTAHIYLQDLPMLKKYGVAPAHDAGTEQATKAAPTAGTKPTAPSKPAATDSDDENTEAAEPPKPQIDKRPIQYLKGKLISIDCSQDMAATLTVSSGMKIIKLHTADYKSLTLVGADQFSCDWRGRQVSVNYRARGKDEGDLVTLELQ
jgi:tetratricopeptide (TPR) repeat protein